MKRVFRIVAVVFFIILLLLGALYLWVIRPGQKFIEENKASFVEKVTAFNECIVEKPGAECAEEFLIKANRDEKSIVGLTLFGTKIKNSLGKQVTVIPVDDSFHWEKYVGSDGPSVTVKFTLKVIYEKDPDTTESVILMRQGEGPFLIKSYYIHSNKLLN